MTGVLTNAVTPAIAFITACIIVWQVRAMQHATYATAFKAVYDILQSDARRADRAFVMEELKTNLFPGHVTKVR